MAAHADLLYIILAIIVYAAAGAILILSARVAAKKLKGENESDPILSNITLDFIYKLYLPVMICGEDGKIIWYNRAMSKAEGSDETLYDKHISEIGSSQLSLDRILGTRNEDGVFCTLDQTEYVVKGYKINSHNKTFTILIWEDRTQLNTIVREAFLHDPVVAHIILDNLEDISRDGMSSQNIYRNATSAISSALQKWAAGTGGIIREYDRDRYIFVFERRSLNAFIEQKFDILDTIRELTAETSDMPFTVSIGVSSIDGTLAEKDAAARQALDLALQRGGDQAVVKGIQSTEFFGGKSKTVQKRTKIRSRVIAGELSNLMKSASNVLIMGHKYIDHDCTGACIGIARLALSLNCRTNIVVNIHDSNLKNVFAKLRGVADYKNMFIDSVTGLDLVESKTLLVIADVNNPQYFENIDIYKNISTVAIIDHHRKTGDYVVAPVITYIEPSASSTCELVSEVLEQALVPGYLLKEEAELLLAGIILDTKQFSRNTGVRTFSAALYLRGEGANPVEAAGLFKTGLEDFTKEANFQSNVVIYRGIVAISVYEGEADNADKIAAAKVADRLLSIDNVLASFVLCRIGDTVHISARSAGTINVQLILETLGGGGHFDVAGAQAKGTSMKDVLNVLRGAIDNYLNEI
ncbi:MAG: DHH family phosphoesterase [Eubacteriales bacterium]